MRGYQCEHDNEKVSMRKSVCEDVNARMSM